MKILSIENPLAYFIIFGIKDVENFDWTTEYRGDVLIHTTGSTQKQLNYEPLPESVWNDYDKYCQIFDGSDQKNEEAWDYFYDGNCDTINERILALTALNDIYNDNKQSFLSGQSIIGIVELVDVVQNSSSPFAEEGLYHWVFKNPRILFPCIKNIPGDLNLEDASSTITSKIVPFDIEQQYVTIEHENHTFVAIKDIPLKMLDIELQFIDNTEER